MTEPQTAQPTEPSIVMIDANKIDARHNIRRMAGDARWQERIQELEADIRAKGILEPLEVSTWNRPCHNGRPYRLVAGHRRYEAGLALGYGKFPCIVKTLTESEIIDHQLSENLQREDLTEIDEARGFQAWLEETKATQSELAARIGKSQPYVANRLRLLQLRPEVQDAVQAGNLSASHAEVLLMIPKEASGLQGHIAKEVVKGRLPVQDLRRHVEHEVARWKQDQVVQDALTAAKAAGAKVLSCPLCGQYGQPEEKRPEKFYVLEGRPVLQHTRRYYDEVHRWYGDTGDRYFTPAEQKDLERQKAAEKKRRSASAKEAAKKATVTKRIDRDYAVLFTRATLQEWAEALLQETKKEISGLTVSYGGSFEVEASRESAAIGDLHLEFDPVDVADGNGGKFHSRIQIGSFASGPRGVDDVAEGPYTAELRKARTKVLEFQRSKIGWKQGAKEFWPVEISGFKVGEKVRLGDKTPWQSYVGKQGVVLALDWRTFLPGGGFNSASSGKREPAAVLGIAASRKVFWLSSLEHLEASKK